MQTIPSRRNNNQIGGLGKRIALDAELLRITRGRAVWAGKRFVNHSLDHQFDILKAARDVGSRMK